MESLRAASSLEDRPWPKTPTTASGRIESERSKVLILTLDGNSWSRILPGYRESMEVEEYLRSSFRPDCEFIEGDVLERNVGLKRHSWALGQIGVWFHNCPLPGCASKLFPPTTLSAQCRTA